MSDEIQRDLGPQPIDELLRNWELENHELVAASTEQLTHKQVQKARKGRRVTGNIQRKILNALRTVVHDKGLEEEVSLGDLFNYRA